MAKITKETDSPRTPAEDRFLAECLLAFDVKAGKIDMSAVAQAMSYSNQHSADNKYGELKKKFNVDLKTFHTSPIKTKRQRTGSPETPTKTTPKRARRKRAATMAFESQITEKNDGTA